MNHQQAVAWLAGLIAHAETPTFLSQRDGKLLPLVPRNERLVPSALETYLDAGLAAYDVADLDKALAKTTSGKRCLAAWGRSVAYLTAGNAKQALKDAHIAVAYAPTQVDGKCPTQLSRQLELAQPPAHSGMAQVKAAEDLRPALRCGWPPALAALAAAFLAAQQHVEGALVALMALRLCPTHAPALTALDTAKTQLPSGVLSLLQGTQHSPLPLSSGTATPLAAPQTRHPAPPAPVGTAIQLTRFMAALQGTDQDTHRGRHDTEAGISQELVQQGRYRLGDGDKGGQGSVTEAQYDSMVTALLTWRQGQILRSVPEYLRPNDKYHHYYKWMRERLHTALGLPAPPDTETCAIESATALCATDTESADRQATGTRPVVPSTVVDKMLDMNADDLDLLLKYPVAAAAQVWELMCVLRLSGPNGLARHTITPPSWDEVQMLTGPGCVGLPIGCNGGMALQTLPPPAPAPATADTPLALTAARDNPQAALAAPASTEGVGALAVVAATEQQQAAQGRLRLLADAIVQPGAETHDALQQGLCTSKGVGRVVGRREVLQWVFSGIATGSAHREC